MCRQERFVHGSTVSPQRHNDSRGRPDRAVLPGRKARGESPQVKGQEVRENTMFMRFVKDVLALAGAVALLVEMSFSSSGERRLPTYQFERVQTMLPAGKQTGGMKPFSVPAAYWIKGSAERMESTAGKGKRISLFKEGFEYRWLSPSNKTLRKKVDKSRSMMHSSRDWIVHPENLIHELEMMGIRKTKQQTIDGKVCDLYVYKTLKSRSGAKVAPTTTQVWIWREKRFPLREERGGVVEELQRIPTSKQKAAKQKPAYKEVKRQIPYIVRTDYKKVVIGNPIPDRLFEVPKNVKVVESGQVHQRVLGH